MNNLLPMSVLTDLRCSFVKKKNFEVGSLRCAVPVSDICNEGEAPLLEENYFI
mgnify:FL=1